MRIRALDSKGQPMEYLCEDIIRHCRKMNAKRIQLDDNPFLFDIDNLVNGFAACVDMIIV